MKSDEVAAAAFWRVCDFQRATRLRTHLSPGQRLTEDYLWQLQPPLPCSLYDMSFCLCGTTEGSDAHFQTLQGGLAWTTRTAPCCSAAPHIRVQQSETTQAAMQSPPQQPSAIYQRPKLWSCWALPGCSPKSFGQTTGNCGLRVPWGGSFLLTWEHQQTENALFHFFHRT